MTTGSGISIGRNEKDPIKQNTVIQQLIEGRSNAVGSFALTANASSTVVSSVNCAPTSVVAIFPVGASLFTEYKTTTYTTGSGTHTTATGCALLEVYAVGGGGGGGGSSNGTDGGAGANGGNTTFGGVTAGGGGGAGNAATGGGGGSASGGSVLNVPGGLGSGSNASANTSGMPGGSSSIGGGGGGGAWGNSGLAASTNSGGGGGGGGGSLAGSGWSGAGGGAGGTVRHEISSPAASYSYAVGAGGAGGTAGTSGLVGGAGAAGIIIVKEHIPLAVVAGNGQFTVTHANNSRSDRTFLYMVQG